MMSEDHPLVGADKIAAVFKTLGGGSAKRIQSQHLGCNELAVKAISQGVTAYCCHHQPHRTQLFPSSNGDGSHRKSTCCGHSHPDHCAYSFGHGESGPRELGVEPATAGLVAVLWRI